MVPKRTAQIVGVLVVALLVMLGVQRWQLHQADEAKKKAELDAGLAASRVLSAKFEATGELRAARLTGEVLSVGDCKSGNVINNRQRTIAPYAVSYSVDLAKIDRSNFRWDGPGHTMFVELPGLTVEPPAIDLSRARSKQDGIFISRACGLAMQTQVAGRLSAAAGERAQRPDYLATAANSARLRVAQLVRSTLSSAGLTDITVRVRLATDPRPSDDRQWDRSRSIEEVLADPRFKS